MDRSTTPCWLYLLTFIPPLLLLTLVWLQPWASIFDLFRDPLAAAMQSDDCCRLYFGFVSNIGVVIWCICGGCCLFAALHKFHLEGWSENTKFLVAAGGFTTFLGVDDLFLLHDHILPALHIGQLITSMLYAAIGISYLARFHKLIISHDLLLFLLAGGLLAMSVSVDQFFHSERPFRIFLEDGAKLLGICAWAAFHISASFILCGGKNKPVYTKQ